MEQTNTHPAWMDDELVKDISPAKLSFLSQLFIESKGKSQKEMMSFFLPMMQRAKAQNLTFTQAEISACIQAIKKHSSTEELSQIDALLKKSKERS
ncbi:MAG: hypothetical protein IJX63_12160 [Lachnospiraceae bacterium]|nr:hypothetical protein [Lachnospiraceae bacterium]